MEEGKIKNTITRSFELNDYRVKGTELSGFWADLLSKEELTVDVNYKPENGTAFTPEEVGKISKEICRKCDWFEAELPENINCEVTFKDFGEKIYNTEQPGIEIDPRELEEIKVMYRFFVAYYI
ncbi:hypothetical protein ACSAZK_17000 [Methanosarcina sp. Mfa9]|uniref:hypothetical protein n=1 Tax=Methanosarcina sp. Mfa9 TaxID=3439063 RepID=UPI003F86853F